MEEVVDAAFWRGRRVFLTGHTGFKGGWLAFWLHSLGAEVCGYALAPLSPGFFGAADLRRSLAGHHTADIGDAGRLARAMAEFAPDIVFHLAAQSLVRESYREPLQTYATNVLGTANVLNALRGAETAAAAVVVTSDKCYENREGEKPLREEDALGGRDPYSSSKACAEIVARAMAESFFGGREIGVATARAGNVIGGGDWAQDRLLPDIVRMLSGEGDALSVRNPDAVRPWQHVLEPLAGYLTLAQHCRENSGGGTEGWNFGPDEGEGAATVGEVAKMMEEEWGGELPEGGVDDDGDGSDGSDGGGGETLPYEAKFLRLDSAKAQKRLRWKPRLTLRQAVRMTAEWHRAHLRGDDMREFTLSQIGEYERAGKGKG